MPRARMALTWLAFILLFVALDRLSYVHAFHGLAITPWNPNTGLAFAFLMRAGWRQALPVAVAAIAADQLVRGTPLAVSLPTEALYAGVYAVAARLLDERFGIGLVLERPRQFTVFFAVAAVAAAVVALGRVVLASGLPEFEPAWVEEMLLRQWVGDLIGIALFAPLFLLLAAARRRIDAPSPERLGQIALTIAVAGLVFGFEATDEFQFFYLFFLPVIWLALRGGLGPTLVAMALIQCAMIAATTLRDMDDGRVAALQFLMLTLVLTGSLMAATAEARLRAELAIRERMNELARMSRIHTSNEIAAGLAHELKQPMLAMVNYVGAACRLLERDPPDVPEALKLMRHTDAQVMRADGIIRRMRDFTRKGEIQVARVDLAAVAREALDLVDPLARRHGVAIDLKAAAALPPVMADGVQVLQVLVNLVSNAVLAIADADSPERVVFVDARSQDPATVLVEVSDTGPGLAGEAVETIFEPFVSTRPDGIGVGLAISRAIVEAHGGRLWHDDPVPGRGATFRFTLPVEGAQDEC
ncbi:MAG: ATP-binding protein [Pseudomonadota bacterium]